MTKRKPDQISHNSLQVRGKSLPSYTIPVAAPASLPLERVSGRLSHSAATNRAAMRGATAVSFFVCVASVGALSCVHHSGIPKRSREKCRDTSCRAGTSLSHPINSALFAGCCGRRKQPRILLRSAGATSGRQNAGSQANTSRRSLSWSPSSSKCLSAHKFISASAETRGGAVK